MTVAPFLICALPSILLLLFVPPLMNYGDSASLLCGSLADNAAQRPLLYPCFVQYFVKTFGFTNLAIYSILCLQHILVLAGASYMVLSVKEPGQRVLLALMAVFANFFFLLNNGIYSESLDSGFLFFYFGTALRLTLQSNIENRAGLLVLSFVSVAFMGLSNPYLLAFSVLIPAAYLFNALVSRDKQKLSAELKPFLQSLLVVFLAVFTILAANFLTENLLGQSLLPSFGRVSLPVMRSFPWSSIPKEQKSALLAKMQKRCSGDYSRLALSFIVAGNYGNVDVYQQLKALEAQFGHGKNAEQAISNAALAFFFTPNRYLANQAVNGFYKCMGEDSFVNWLSLRSGTSRCLNSIIDAAATSSRIYQSDRSIEQRLSQIPALKNSEPSKYFQVASLLNTACFDGVCHYIPLMLIAVILSLSGLALGASSKERLAFVLHLFLDFPRQPFTCKCGNLVDAGNFGSSSTDAGSKGDNAVAKSKSRAAFFKNIWRKIACHSNFSCVCSGILWICIELLSQLPSALGGLENLA